MISGIIHVERPEEPDTIDALADTLAALVTGVAAGLVGDAVIVACRSGEGLETIAEGSGAELVLHAGDVSPWFAGARAARREWLLCLAAGDVLHEGWIRSLDRFVGTARRDCTLARLRRPHAGLVTRMVKRGERVFGVTRPRAGDLVRRDTLMLGPVFRPRPVPRLLNVHLGRS